MISLRDKLGINGEHKDLGLVDASRGVDIVNKLCYWRQEKLVIIYKESQDLECTNFDLFISGEVDSFRERKVFLKGVNFQIPLSLVYDFFKKGDINPLFERKPSLNLYTFQTLHAKPKKFSDVHFHKVGAYLKISETRRYNRLRLVGEEPVLFR